jgi:hypothetical protein
MEKKIKSKLIKTRFRDKRSGWKRYSITYNFDNNKEISRILRADPYMRIFLKDIALRPSCYKCVSKGTDQLSDLLIADFWNSQDILPQFDDNKGVSLVIANTSKGNKLFNLISDNLLYEPIEEEIIKEKNKAIYNTAKWSLLREQFYVDLVNKDYKFIINKYAFSNIKEHIIKVLWKYNLIK